MMPSAFILLLQPSAIGEQSALRTAGPAANEIGALWNLMLGLGLGATVLTFTALAYALFRKRRSHELPPEADRPADAGGELHNDESGGRGREDVGRPRSERRGVQAMIVAGVIVPVVVLSMVLVVTLRVLAKITPTPTSSNTIVIDIAGRQYWWAVRYLDAEPSRIFETANELHLPVGIPVQLRLRTVDVIHSFWVPGLAGKMDLVPGRTNVMTLQADRAGVWRGQCAEFCGVQHGKMAIVVVAEPKEQFERWRAAQQASATSVTLLDSAQATAQLADRDVFLRSGCVLCHAVRGTSAGGRAGPDLTHIATRLTLAAGTLPNNTGNLYGWIADPQSHKPGSAMPAVPMTAVELHAIARYLGSLK